MAIILFAAGRHAAAEDAALDSTASSPPVPPPSAIGTRLLALSFRLLTASAPPVAPPLRNRRVLLDFGFRLLTAPAPPVPHPLRTRRVLSALCSQTPDSTVCDSRPSPLLRYYGTHRRNRPNAHRSTELWPQVSPTGRRLSPPAPSAPAPSSLR